MAHCGGSVKWVGLFTIAWVGLYTLADLWELWGDRGLPWVRGVCLQHEGAYLSHSWAWSWVGGSAV